MTRKGHAESPKLHVSPVASYEVQRSLRQANLLVTIFYAIKSGFSPGPDGPKNWYGRTFLFVGTILVVLLFGLMLALKISELIRH